MKKLLFSCIVAIVICFSCTDRDDEITTANIRVKNETSVEFNLVEVIADSIFYENVMANGFSSYLPYEQAFSQMPFRIETDSVSFTFTPNDTLQEPLPIGLYTYEVDINEAGEVLLSFKID